eukprot:766697-Hanusia_phi.AAC.8
MSGQLELEDSHLTQAGPSHCSLLLPHDSDLLQTERANKIRMLWQGLDEEQKRWRRRRGGKEEEEAGGQQLLEEEDDWTDDRFRIIQQQEEQQEHEMEGASTC